MIPEIASVLAVTDFSDFAAKAIPHAYAVVGEGGTVHILHVIDAEDPSQPPNPLYAHYVPGRAPTPAERKLQHDAIVARLEALAPEGAAGRSIRTQAHVVYGSEVASAIREVAQDLDVSLVCIASHGRTGILRAVLGSVAMEVLAKSKRPVLVVR